MRRMISIAMALCAALFAAVPASAGLHVVYIDVQKSKQLQIDIADNGDARIYEVGSKDYGLLIGGEFHVVDNQSGKPTVARIRDVAAAIDAVMPPIFKGLFDQPGAPVGSAKLKIVPGEAGNAGGREGRVYHVSGFNDATPEKVTDYLINSDADLKPAGVALEAFMNAAIVPAAPLIGEGARELIEETRAIFALGTPIDIGGRFRLNLAAKTNFPPSRFALPAKPMSIETLVIAMKAQMAAKAGVPAQPQQP